MQEMKYIWLFLNTNNRDGLATPLSLNFIVKY